MSVVITNETRRRIAEREPIVTRDPEHQAIRVDLPQGTYVERNGRGYIYLENPRLRGMLVERARRAASR